MRSRYRITVGGVQLDSIDKDLLILDIGCTHADEQVTTTRSANTNGYDYGDSYVEKTIVTVTFELHIYDIARRNAVCQAVNKWAAAGGTMSLNDHTDQRLYYTRCEKYASIESARNWTDPLTLVFATTYEPHWCSQTEKTLTLTGKNAQGTLKLDGNTGSAPVSVTATVNTAITAFQITVGNTVIKLPGISVAAGKKIVIDYVRSRILRVRIDGKSAMAKLDPTSSDQLLAPCGANTVVKVDASGGKVTSVITARGRWL